MVLSFEYSIPPSDMYCSFDGSQVIISNVLVSKKEAGKKNVTYLGMYIVLIFVYDNDLSLIDCNFESELIVSVWRFLHSAKQYCSSFKTSFGKIIVENGQYWKQYSEIAVKCSGRTIFDNWTQPRKAYELMFVRIVQFVKSIAVSFLYE